MHVTLFGYQSTQNTLFHEAVYMVVIQRVHQLRAFSK